MVATVVLVGVATEMGEACTRDDPDSQMVIPIKRRRIILDLFKEHDVEAMFSGHWHKNKYFPLC